MRIRSLTCAALIACVFATSACGGDTTEQADVQRVDVTKLDSGSYPTAPIDIERFRTDQSGAAREAIRIGAATPLVSDIDNRYIYQNPYRTHATTPKSPPSLKAVDRSEFDAVAPGLVTGWYTQGQRRKEFGIGSEVLIYVLRFSDESHASAAVKELIERVPGDSISIPGYPAARARHNAHTEFGTNFLSTGLAHGEMALLVQINDPISRPFAPGPPADLTGRSFDKLIDMLRQYTPTPIDKISALPLDVDGMLSRTVPLDDNNKPVDGSDPSGVYPAQALLHSEQDPNSARSAYADAGVDYAAAVGAVVLRAKDSAGTTRLLAAISAPVSAEYDKLDSPANLPEAKCFKPKKGPSKSPLDKPVCYFAFDRYVAQVSSNNVQDLQQKTAAQYKLLAYGR
ncbi:hypothetical protein OHB12_29535 [Nocardia sp. NBC_01730]|uniref:DUF7373 family lipoprotein n=1 Tax=Nocardia sp. NBC_01730 TaxID=2975998 RepID=UPI002E131A68|nr:hypothetical protein OHB12_29535 [Nocardia sp. NBC_01730]